MPVRDNEIPDGLSDLGRKAAEVIVALAVADGAASTGGGRSFYTLAEWKERGEEYGHQAELIVVHDGGDLAKYFNYDYCVYGAIERMDEALAKAGLHAGPCTSWYTAIYKEGV